MCPPSNPLRRKTRFGLATSRDGLPLLGTDKPAPHDRQRWFRASSVTPARCRKRPKKPAPSLRSATIRYSAGGLPGDRRHVRSLGDAENGMVEACDQEGIAAVAGVVDLSFRNWDTSPLRRTGRVAGPAIRCIAPANMLGAPRHLLVCIDRGRRDAGSIAGAGLPPEFPRMERA
jgi:hypothetical protein